MPEDPTVPAAAPAPKAAPVPAVPRAVPAAVAAPAVPRAVPAAVAAPAVPHAVPAQPGPPAAPPAKPAPSPEKWSARVIVPGARAPGQRTPAAPVATTSKLARFEPTRPFQMVARLPGARVRRRRMRRFFTAVLALVLILAVPVVSAYVAYKLASGENPFQWPPSMDLSKVLGRV